MTFFLAINTTQLNTSVITDIFQGLSALRNKLIRKVETNMHPASSPGEKHKIHQVNRNLSVERKRLGKSTVDVRFASDWLKSQHLGYANYAQIAQRVCKLKLVLHRVSRKISRPSIQKFICLYLAKKIFFRPEILQARLFYCVLQPDGKSLNSEKCTLVSSTTLRRTTERNVI